MSALPALASLGATPAAATTTSAATAASDTGGCEIAFYRSSCAKIKNATEGFAAPGQPSRPSGFPFTFVKWIKQGHGYDAAHSAKILPDTTGFAYARNTGGFVTGVEGTYVYAAGGLLTGQGTSEVFLHMDTPLTGRNGASCISGTYVYCDVGQEQGHSKDPIWPVTLTTRPLVVRIDNFLSQRLRLEAVTQANNLIRDPAGDRNVTEIPADPPGRRLDRGGAVRVAGSARRRQLRPARRELRRPAHHQAGGVQLCRVARVRDL